MDMGCEDWVSRNWVSDSVEKNLKAEGLSRIIIREENLGNIHGIRIGGQRPTVSHLFYLLFFSKANVSESQKQEWSKTAFPLILVGSGQKINSSKSAIFFSKNCKHAVSSSNISAKAKYLGIHLFFHRSKKRSFADLKDKMLSKISGWKSKLLSQAATTTLLKSVANAIPSYIMSLFLLP
jgi:hypothetical protein